MKKIEKLWRLAGRRVLYATALALVLSPLLSAALTGAVSSGSPLPAWAAPTAMALRRASAVTSAQSEPNFLDNLDCGLVTYRLVAGTTMQTGCFTETAFGLFDSDSGVVIFNGTDEGLPLVPYAAHQVLAPWPGALDLVTFTTVSTGGSYISLYKNPLAAVRDQRDLLGQLTAKQLITPPELSLKDPDGNKLIVNPETLAFSDGGSWLVIETLSGSFVRINLATLEVTAFAPAYSSQSTSASLKSAAAVSGDGRFVAIANDSAKVFKVYDLGTCSGLAVGLQPENCQSYDYRPFTGRQIAGLQSVEHVRFISDGLLSFEAASSTPANDGIYELAPAASITSLTDYIGLGDSYTSGEGAFDYLAGTDTPEDMCHLSRDSYPLLLTHDLFSSSGGHSVACSGAVINDVGSTSDNYRGQVSGVASWQQLQETDPLLVESVETNFVPGYVAQQRFVQRWQPRVTTLSVGGDDIGFGNLLQTCVEPHVSRHLSDSTCYDTYEDRLELTRLIDRTMPRWTALYKQLKREAPGTQLYAIGYPQIVADTGTCALNVQLNKNELEFAEDLLDYLNHDIEQSASAAGVPYVDISQALAGHRLCETASYDVAVNGLTAGTDGGPLGLRIFGKESYHPNALGQALIEQSILKQTHNLQETAPPVGGSTTGNSPLLNAPKTGRTVSTRVPDNGLTTGVGKRGASTSVQASGSRDGLSPRTIYTINLDGPQGTVLGTTTSDDAGDVSTSVTIPGSTAPGGHTIDVTGGNQAGEPVDVTQPIYVPGSDTDSDGDGIPDSLDSCPGAINSGQDADQDGIDDICDSLIGLPPGSTDSSNQSSQNENSDPTTSTSIGTTGSTGSNPSAAPPPSGTSSNLAPEPETVAASFSSDGDEILPSVTDEVPLAISGATLTSHSDNTVAIGRVLGAATANPSTVTPSTFKSVTKTGVSGPALPPQILRTIRWLFWTILLVVCLLVLLLAEKYTNTAGFPLQ